MIPEIQTDEETSMDISSYNHSLVQSNLAGLFFVNYRTKYHALTQPTLKLDNWESEPDVAIFPKRLVTWHQDEIKITEIPLLVIEIILPKQGGHDLMEKFMKYFEYGVPSCWLVNPLTETIHVYSPDWTYQLYGVGSDKIKDKSLNIEIDFQEVFS